VSSSKKALHKTVMPAKPADIQRQDADTGKSRKVRYAFVLKIGKISLHQSCLEVLLKY
jgi:hypothetical protein